MLRRGSDPNGPKKRRSDVIDVAELLKADRPNPATASGADAPEAPAPELNPLEGWTQITSFHALDAPLVAELARAAMGSGGVVVLQSGEVAVGAMLASLAVRGHDDLVQQLIVTGQAEMRLHRYATGRLDPVAVHRMRAISDALRALAWCAATGAEDTFELVADDGRGSVAIGAARFHELRWLQPPPDSSPHDAPWAPVTTEDPPPGADPRWWRQKLSLPGKPVAARPAAGLAGLDLPPSLSGVDWTNEPPLALPTGAITQSSFTGPAQAGGPAAAAPAAVGGDTDPAELYDLVAVSVNKALSEALVELEIDPAAIEELRDNPVLDETFAKVRQIEQHLLHLGPLNRQIHELTTVVEDLHDTMRSIVRQQWEAAPPQNYWNRAQRSSDELQRAIDDLASELRSRLPRALPE